MALLLAEAGSLCRPLFRLEVSIFLGLLPLLIPLCLRPLSTHTMVSSHIFPPLHPHSPCSPRHQCHQPRPPWRHLHL